jgi:hypothetical protein
MFQGTIYHIFISLINLFDNYKDRCRKHFIHLLSTLLCFKQFIVLVIKQFVIPTVHFFIIILHPVLIIIHIFFFLFR